MRHEFEFVGHEALLTDDQEPEGAGLFVNGEPAGSIWSQRALKAEVIRLLGDRNTLAERVRELEGVVAVRDATLAMAVARLGGEVEGAPTHRGNFLQRIDQLVEESGRLDAAEITAEEGQEIIAEVTTAFAVLFGESLTPCAGGCPGHLGEKARAAATEALDRWTALEEENRRLRGEAETRADCNRQLVGRVEFLEGLVKLDLTGYVVWHRHDGGLVKLVPVSEAEELVPGATISVSYNPHPEEVS